MLLDAHVGGMPVCGRDVGEPWRGEGRETDSELNFSCRSRDRDATMNGSVPIRVAEKIGTFLPCLFLPVNYQ